MRGSSIQALFARAAHRVDLTHHALTDPRSVLRFDYFTHKLMPQNSSIWIISFDQFEVGTANTGFADLYQSLIWLLRLRDFTEIDLVIFEPQRFHLFLHRHPAISPAVLCRIHGGIGAMQELFPVFLPVLELRHTDAHGQRNEFLFCRLHMQGADVTT